MNDAHPQYHKIPTIWARESEKPHRLIPGRFSSPELKMLMNLPWEATEKVDGTNVRIGWDGQEVRFGGKTDRAQLPMHLVEELLSSFGGEEGAQLFEQTFGETPVTLYGEGYGAKIQKGGGNYDPDGAHFVLFDVLIDGWWLESDNVRGIAGALGADLVPFVGYHTLLEASEIIQEGFNSEWPEVEPEGLVLRAPLGLRRRSGDRLICKIKGKDFG